MERIDPPHEPNRGDEPRDESIGSDGVSASSPGARGSGGASMYVSGVSTNDAKHTNGPSSNGSSAEVTATIGSARPGPVCRVCPIRANCRAICELIEAILPSPERGRVDAEDLSRLYSGIRMRRALLDWVHILTERQQEVVRLYYRESLQQAEIAEQLGVTQQAVHDSLRRARKTIGERILHAGRSQVGNGRTGS